jgi:hypothetical protein
MVSPCVVATGGDLEHTTHDADEEFGLVRPYESEDFRGTAFVS